MTGTPGALPPAPRRADLPVGFRLVLDSRVKFWTHGALMAGGSPWRIAQANPRARDFVGRLRKSGPEGTIVVTDLDRAVARLLIDRGFAHPAISWQSQVYQPNVSVVVPAYDRVPALERCLRALRVDDVLVVDDFSNDGESIAKVCARANARVFRQPENRGPAAARNTGLLLTTSELVAFVDSDCVVAAGWLEKLVLHFADPKVAMVAPRVIPDASGRRLLARHETARSALDMGRRAEQVRPGARLSFVPSAAIVVRRAALAGSGFDESLRLGEDVDLVWRLVKAGWQVRFDPSVVVKHQSLVDPIEWVSRRFAYGTSAADLSQRHPGQLAPVRVSAWNLATLGLLTWNRPRIAAFVAVVASTLLARRLRARADWALLPPMTIATGTVADAAAIGHAMRREWWPLGAASLALAHRSRLARAMATAMLAPLVWEWVRHRPAIDPVRYFALRLIEDAAYGSGVIDSAVRQHTAAPLTPSIRWPRFRRAVR